MPLLQRSVESRSLEALQKSRSPVARTIFQLLEEIFQDAPIGQVG